MISTPRLSTAVCLLLLFVGGLSARAANAEDRVYLKNGDRITGEIQEIWDEDVVIEPVYDDDTQISISIDEVAYIESDRDFEVTLNSGREFLAKPAGQTEDGDQIFEVDGSPMLLRLSDLRELDEVEDYFDWESHIDINASLNKGNTDNLSAKFFADTNLKLGDHRHIASLTLYREEENGDSTKEQDLLRYDYNWLFDEPWFLATSFSAERDPIKDLDHRLVFGLLLGRDIWDLPKRELSIQLGPGYLTEKTDDGTEDSVAGLWAVRVRQDLLKDDLELYHNHSVNSAFSGNTNTIFKTTTGLRFEITDLLYWTVSLDYNYETDPASDADNEDLSLLLGLGLEL